MGLAVLVRIRENDFLVVRESSEKFSVVMNLDGEFVKTTFLLCQDCIIFTGNEHFDITHDYYFAPLMALGKFLGWNIAGLSDPSFELNMIDADGCRSQSHYSFSREVSHGDYAKSKTCPPLGDLLPLIEVVE